MVAFKRGVLELPTRPTWQGYAAAVIGVAGVTVLLAAVGHAGEIANISMLYLLVVIGVAVGFGSQAAVAASVLAFFAFNWFFTQPYHRLTVYDAGEWVALVTFLITAAVVGQLTGLLRTRADLARRRERETAALAEASWSVTAQVDRHQALTVLLQHLAAVSGAAGAVLVRHDGGELGVIAQVAEATSLPDLTPPPLAAAVEFVLDQGQSVAWGESSQLWAKALGPALPAGLALLPLGVEHRVLGVLVLRLRDEHPPPDAVRRVVEALARHAGVVLERERLVRIETQTQAVVEAERLKTALLSMVSHDFRSPLASILASATGLLEEGSPVAPATQRQLLQGIATEARRLNAMVENLLALSRLEAGAWRPQLEPVPVEELVWAVFNGFTRAESQRIVVAADPQLAEVSVDSVQMVEVLHNLLENALKYAPGESPVELFTHAEGGQAVFEVRDRGPGLPPGGETQVFEPFYRAPHLRESADPGIGMGLAVCRGLVEAHRGRLTAHPREGGGTVFRIELPLETAS